MEYSNRLSKVLLKSVFEEQFAVPELPPKAVELFLRWYEKHRLKVNVSGIVIDRPIFLIALPRSGSTMVQDILCAHPNVAYFTNCMHQFRTCFCAAEHFRKRFDLNVRGERYLQDSVLVDSGSPSEGIVFWGEWFKEDPHSLKYVEKTIKDFRSSEVDEIYHSIKKVIWCFKGRANRFFNKNPALLPRLPLVVELFPDAKFIHLVRDARPSANSLVKLYHVNLNQLERIRSNTGHSVYQERPFIPYPRLPGLDELIKEYGVDDIRTTAHLWNKSLEFVHRYKKDLPHFYEVRFEDILKHPQREMGKILEFCELPPPSVHDAGEYWQKLHGVGRTHHKNRYGQFDLIESICNDWMKRYGYL